MHPVRPNCHGSRASPQIEKSLSVGPLIYLVYGAYKFFRTTADHSPGNRNFTPQASDGKISWNNTPVQKIKSAWAGQTVPNDTNLIHDAGEKIFLKIYPIAFYNRYRWYPRSARFRISIFRYDTAIPGKATDWFDLKNCSLRNYMALIKDNATVIQRHHFFGQVGEMFQYFYEKHLPFRLTNAQR